LSPAKALALAALGDFLGAYFLGTAVAETLGKGIVDPSLIAKDPGGIAVIIAALIGAISWNLITWRLGMPSSSSHALIGGLVGAFFVGWGAAPINLEKVRNIVFIMISSPLIGFAITYFVTRITLGISAWLTPRANRAFNKLQLVSLFLQSLSHGTNDAQKTMGVITFVLVMTGFYIPQPGGALAIPSWVIIACSLAIALGTIMGGWRIIRTLGTSLYKIRSVHAFASQTTSAIILYTTALFGYPISTTQVISSAVTGAGAATRFKMIRWNTIKDMALAWLVTLPASALIAGAALLFIKSF
ncbi:MAG: inorganic phosphate transporter, partial [Patescibacteria group bacterium]